MHIKKENEPKIDNALFNRYFLVVLIIQEPFKLPLYFSLPALSTRKEMPLSALGTTRWSARAHGSVSAAQLRCPTPSPSPPVTTSASSGGPQPWDNNEKTPYATWPRRPKKRHYSFIFYRPALDWGLSGLARWA